VATVIYTGNASLTAQVITLTPGGTWEIGDLIVVTFGSKVWSYAVTSATVATFTPLFATAWNALAATEHPEFAEITASSTSTTITLTSDTKGMAISPVCTTTEANGDVADMQTLSQSTTTANVGPSDWTCTDNWSTRTVPVSTDDVIIDGAICNTDLLYNLDQNAVALTSLKIINGYTGKLGLAERNTTGTAYDEYRQTALKIGITTLDIDCNSGRIKIDGDTDQSAVTVRASGASSDAKVPAVEWIGSHASGTVNVLGGTVGIALRASQTATVLTLTQSGGDVKCGAGVTLGTVQKTGGTLTILGGSTTAIVNDGGDVTIYGSGTHTAITNSGSKCNFNGTGTITAYTGNKSSSLTFDGLRATRTLTNGTFNDNASFQDSNRTVTHSNAMTVNGETIGTRVKARRSFTVTPT
jgi:hypothetical protein